jgi:hypothetical protein
MKHVKTVSDSTYTWTSFVPSLGEFLYPSLAFEKDDNSASCPNLQVDHNPVRWTAVPIQKDAEALRRKELQEQERQRWEHLQSEGEKILRDTENHHPGMCLTFNQCVYVHLQSNHMVCFLVTTRSNSGTIRRASESPRGS